MSFRRTLCVTLSTLIALSATSHLILYYQTTCAVQTKNLRPVSVNQENRTSVKSDILKVMLFCYMRGGSTMIGRLFNVDPDATLWYEPLAAFYMANYGMRPASKPHNIMFTNDWRLIEYNNAEMSELVNYIGVMFNCQFNRLPAEAWLHHFNHFTLSLHDMQHCVKTTVGRDPLRRKCSPTTNMCKDDQNLDINREKHCREIYKEAERVMTFKRNMSLVMLEKKLLVYANHTRGGDKILAADVKMLARSIHCIQNVSFHTQQCMATGMRQCDQSTLRIGKLIRLNMQHVVDVLHKYPEFHVVHLVRDPRAIALSRIKTRLSVDPINRDVALEARVLCAQMRNDLHFSEMIMKEFPAVYQRLKYENLVLDPVGSMKQVYEALGRKSIPIVELKKLSQEMFDGERDGSAFGTRRMNGSASIYKWRTEIPLQKLRSIEKYCGDVLHDLNYPLLNMLSNEE